MDSERVKGRIRTAVNAETAAHPQQALLSLSLSAATMLTPLDWLLVVLRRSCPSAQLAARWTDVDN